MDESFRDLFEQCLTTVLGFSLPIYVLQAVGTPSAYNFERPEGVQEQQQVILSTGALHGPGGKKFDFWVDPNMQI